MPIKPWQNVNSKPFSNHWFHTSLFLGGNGGGVPKSQHRLNKTFILTVSSREEYSK